VIDALPVTAQMQVMSIELHLQICLDIGHVCKAMEALLVTSPTRVMPLQVSFSILYYFILFLSPKTLQVGILSLKLAPLGKKPLCRFCEPTYEYCLNLIACL
jgi:hypothetical protein